MTQQEINGQVITFDDEGFMTDPKNWSVEVAQSIAAELDIELTDRHFMVLTFMRQEFENNGAAPSLRKMKNESGVGTKELYKLFPKGPAKKAARIAGLGKPQGCI